MEVINVIKKWLQQLKRFLEDKDSSFTTEEKIPGVVIAKQPIIHRSIHFGKLFIAALLIGFIFWLFLATIESAAIAPGKIVVAGNRRVVQHLEGGIVSHIFVKNGQAVNQGQLLVKLDDTQANAKFESEQGQLLRLLANESRLVASIEDQVVITFPSSVTSKAAQDTDLKKFVANQQASFDSERDTSASQLTILKKRLQQLQEQQKGTQAQLTASDAQLQLVKEELVSLIKLEKERLVDRSRLLSMQREAQRLHGMRGEYQALIASLEQKMGETQIEITAEKQKLDKNWNEELRNVREKIAQAKDRKKSAHDVFSRTNIVSPISGIVTNLSVFTIGAVVKPGETLLEIVPQHEELVVEARINPLDIDVVHPGLTAKITLSALKTRTTPILLGKVAYISADAKTDEKTNQNYYEARIHIDEQELQKITDHKALYPGMPVEAIIITNKMSPWDYFMDPVRRSFRRAFREE